MKQDISGHVLDRVVERVFAITERMEKLLPLGPTNVHMTKSEVIKKASKDGNIGTSVFRDMLDQSEIMQVLQNGKSNTRPARQPQIVAGSEEATKKGGIYEN